MLYLFPEKCAGWISSAAAARDRHPNQRAMIEKAMQPSLLEKSPVDTSESGGASETIELSEAAEALSTVI